MKFLFFSIFFLFSCQLFAQTTPELNQRFFKGLLPYETVEEEKPYPTIPFLAEGNEGPTNKPLVEGVAQAMDMCIETVMERYQLGFVDRSFDTAEIQAFHRYNVDCANPAGCEFSATTVLIATSAEGPNGTLPLQCRVNFYHEKETNPEFQIFKNQQIVVASGCWPITE